MRIPILMTLLLPLVGGLHAQRMLHFTRTSGWDHQTRDVSYTMFQSIAGELELEVDDDATGNPFSDPIALAQYAVIVFSNTSGNAILNAQQRANFEAWVEDGGQVLGIHAASDTYRHSTSNGSNTGAWDFYAELIGASVQENPNHVAGTPQYGMQHIGSHASTAELPDPWVKNEEYYYWEGGYYGTDNVEVLRVDETVGPNGLVNNYDAPRPMSWYRFEPTGSRVFYTALGHAPGNFTNDMLFRTHIKSALEWLLDSTTGTQGTSAQKSVRVFPNPAMDRLQIVLTSGRIGAKAVLHDACGRVVLSHTKVGRSTSFDVGHLAAGSYTLCVDQARIPVIITR